MDHKNPTLRPVFCESFELHQIEKVAVKIVHEIASYTRHQTSFCLWLRGELGAGKTTLAAQIMYELGLPLSVPVLSPTFTYITEYSIASKNYAHMDLYRLGQNDEEGVNSLVIDRLFGGLLVEWPERAPTAEAIRPTHVIDIEIESAYLRKYHFYKA
jgi:tRNA threonylcarbamoyladenosine biosynthesis protein TsaE